MFLLLKLLAELATIETAFIFTYVAWRTFLTNASKMPSLKLVQQFVESWNCKFFCPPPPSLYWAVEIRISNPKRNVYLLRIKPIYEYQHDLSSLMKAVIVKSVNELFFWANVCFLIAKTRQKSPNCPSYVDGMRKFELDECVCTDVLSNKTGGGVAKKRGVQKKVGARIPRPPPCVSLCIVPIFFWLS